ncbi:MAG: SDR family oxidoreductase [candidate division Zixibacteria bacterium]|nr:SDR family oxidoreductase [candidate division Zixibacteria bacterium]
MKYLVTGGAGFIGSNIATHLAEKGEQVRILDNFSSGKEKNISSLPDAVEVIEGDIRDYWTVVKAVKDIDYVLHQAALPSVPRSVNNPLTSNAVNIDGTLNMLEAARYAGVKKFVMASSSSVYGESEELPKHEAMTPSPLSPYAVTKLTCEYYLRVYRELYRFPTVALRYFNIFGPHQDPQSEYAAVVPKFITSLINNEAPTVFGDGEQSRDFTYIDNCVQANILAATNDKMVGDQFNVACGGQFTLNDLLDNLRDIIGVDIKAQYKEPRQGDIMHSYATIDKIKRFGYDPKVGFEEGLQHTVKFFKNQIENLQPQ